jgi:antibiotic biosynthesis monooxygenase (ABM) superfamily enzyme
VSPGKDPWGWLAKALCDGTKEVQRASGFVAWCQYALLSAPLSAAAKAALVITVAYLLSWSTTALLRRLPLVAKVV